MLLDRFFAFGSHIWHQKEETGFIVPLVRQCATSKYLHSVHSFFHLTSDKPLLYSAALSLIHTLSWGSFNSSEREYVRV